MEAIVRDRRGSLLDFRRQLVQMACRGEACEPEGRMQRFPRFGLPKPVEFQPIWSFFIRLADWRAAMGM